MNNDSLIIAINDATNQMIKEAWSYDERFKY